MNRFASIVCLTLLAHAGPARAQSTVYVGGDLFLDVQRSSGVISSDRFGLEANVGGGGARIGALFAKRWTLEVGVDTSATAESIGAFDSGSIPVASISFVGLPGAVPPPQPVVVLVEDRFRTKVTAGTVLLGYHPPPRGRMTAGFKGGITFLRTSSTLTETTTYKVNDPRLAPLITVPAPFLDTTSVVEFSTAATVGAEVALALTPHASVVPEVRAFGFGGRLFLRPGAEVRWLF